MTLPQYPLEEIARIKKRRLEEAEKVLREKKEKLLQEEKKMEQVSAERDKVKIHKDAKLSQLREELDMGSTTLKIQQMKNYLKEVTEKLAQKEVKVLEQKKVVDLATEVVAKAREDMLKKSQAVETMKMHKEEWTKLEMAELSRKEEKESDELGNAIFLRKKLENKGLNS